jgi:hypothetical protein
MSNSDQEQGPSPFSRQGSDPSDALGATTPAERPTAPEGASWPTYPSDAPADPAPPSHNPNPNPNPYSDPNYDPYPGSAYGQPSAPAYDQQPAPPYDQQPAPPYGGGYADPTPPAPPANPYGSNPYAANPYDTNPYEVNPYQPSYGGYGAYGIVPTMHPQAVPALVTGILGLAICPFVGIAGLVLGNKARKAIDAEPGRYTGRGQATAGFILGIVSVVYAVLVVLFVLAGASGALDS